MRLDSFLKDPTSGRKTENQPIWCHVWIRRGHPSLLVEAALHQGSTNGQVENRMDFKPLLPPWPGALVPGLNLSNPMQQPCTWRQHVIVQCDEHRGERAWPSGRMGRRENFHRRAYMWAETRRSLSSEGGWRAEGRCTKPRRFEEHGAPEALQVIDEGTVPSGVMSVGEIWQELKPDDTVAIV